METSPLDGADSADDSGSSQPYTQLRGIPKAHTSLSLSHSFNFTVFNAYYNFISFGGG